MLVSPAPESAAQSAGPLNPAAVTPDPASNATTPTPTPDKSPKTAKAKLPARIVEQPRREPAPTARSRSTDDRPAKRSIAEVDPKLLSDAEKRFGVALRRAGVATKAEPPAAAGPQKKAQTAPARPDSGGLREAMIRAVAPEPPKAKAAPQPASVATAVSSDGTTQQQPPPLPQSKSKVQLAVEDAERRRKELLTGPAAPTLTSEMELAREAFRRAKAERQAVLDRQAAALAELNAEKDRLDQINKTKRDENARVAREQLEAQRRKEQAELDEFNERRRMLLEDQEKKRAARYAVLQAKRRELEERANKAKAEALKRQKSFKDREQTLKRRTDAEQAALRAAHEAFRATISEKERRIKEQADMGSTEELRQQQSELELERRKLAGAQSELEAKLAQDKVERERLLREEQEEVARAEALLAEEAARDAAELAEIEGQQRRAEQEARAVAEAMERERLEKEVQMQRIEQAAAEANKRDEEEKAAALKAKAVQLHTPRAVEPIKAAAKAEAERSAQAISGRVSRMSQDLAAQEAERAEAVRLAKLAEQERERKRKEEAARKRSQPAVQAPRASAASDDGKQRIPPAPGLCQTCAVEGSVSHCSAARQQVRCEGRRRRHGRGQRCAGCV